MVSDPLVNRRSFLCHQHLVPDAFSFAVEPSFFLVFSSSPPLPRIFSPQPFSLNPTLVRSPSPSQSSSPSTTPIDSAPVPTSLSPLFPKSPISDNVVTNSSDPSNLYCP